MDTENVGALPELKRRAPRMRKVCVNFAGNKSIIGTMKIPRNIEKNDAGLVGVKIRIAGRERELSVAMSFDLYKALDDASLRAHLTDVAMRNGARGPVIERYRAYQRLDVAGKR